MTTPSANNNTFILTVTSEAKSGIVADVTGYLAKQGCYLLSLEQFDDVSTGNFFLRTEVRIDDDSVSIDDIKQGFASLADSSGLQWQIHDPKVPIKTIIMVSKFDHCLEDLLYRKRKGDLNMEVTCVISNHQDLRATVEREGIRFVHLPVNKENKQQQEARLLEIVDETNSELVLLARYMQILSDDLSRALSGRCINIHHSFLPSFKGAMPYHQAYDRGVKVIGATAHYVTADLDEGPIIEQALTRVDHSYLPKALVRVGRDNESKALARAVKYHIERRVFLDGNKTVVFAGS